MSGWTDTHAHVYLKEFDSDRRDMLARAFESGLDYIYMPNIDHTSIESMLEAELNNPGQCLPMMGLHPCSVAKDFEKELYKVEEWLNQRSFSALGEMGTDLYWDKTFWPQQQEAFVIQAKWAKQFELPLVIHCRNSMDETLDLLTPLADPQLTGVFHCFSGTEEQARKIIDLGFFLGIGGVATFRNGGLDKVLPALPMDRLVLETDSPYLAPVPHRGKRNEPAYIPVIAERVAGLLNVSLDKLKEQTSMNAAKLFRLKRNSIV